MIKAVLFRSQERFYSFQKKLAEYHIDYTVLDFEKHDWLHFDFSNIDLLIYYPLFNFSSNHPLALYKVYDNIAFLHEMHPHLKIYPDPKIIKYYNDKYRQYLFLVARGYPIPKTYSLFSEESVALADKKLGYPMVIKNRFGAGGGSVFRVFNKKELIKYYRLSKMSFFNISSAKHFAAMFTRRLFYYQLVKAKRAYYPFLSAPLLAQQFVKIDRDLKTVVGDYEIVEAHWRLQANEAMWKMNIDGGGIGVWGKVPKEAIDISISLAKDLQANWLNIDLIRSNGDFLITEFSPVWHHYAYEEKPSFVYEADYNIDIPLEVSLDLERIIIESLINAVKKGRYKGRVAENEGNHD